MHVAGSVFHEPHNPTDGAFSTGMISNTVILQLIDPKKYEHD